MSWFDEQIKERVRRDNEDFSDALGSVAGAIMGRRLTEALSSGKIAQSAIEEILKYYHIKEKSSEIPQGMTSPEEQIAYRTAPYGLMRRTVDLEKGWYRHAVGAMLGTMKENGSAVALIPGRFGGYTYLDLKTGKRVRLNHETEEQIDKEAVAFYQPLPQKSLTVRDLMLFMAQQLSASDIAVLIGLTGILSLLGLLSPMFTKWLFGEVLESGNGSVLLALAGFMLSFTVCRLLMTSFRTVINSRIGTKQNIAVQAAVMSRVMSLPPKFFRDYSSGELMQRSSYVQNLCSILFNSIGNVGLTSLFSLIYIGQIFAFAPVLVVPALLITISTVLLGLFSTLAQMKVNQEKMLLSSKTSGLTYSTITGIQKIKLAGAEKRMFSRWAKEYAKEAALEYRPRPFLRVASVLPLAISSVGTLVMYYLAVKSNVGVANYYAFNAAYAMVAGAFSSVASVATTLSNIRPILKMAKPVMEAEPEVTDGKEIVTGLSGGIELSKVSFRYEENTPYIIDDLSLKIRPGEYLAIVGSTGCGKSTLLRLLLGFEKPQKGAIYYDRKDITKVDLRSLRQKIGTVMQDGKLFLGDIYSNIIIAAPQLTLEEAWEAAKVASIDEDIRAMPMGMNTIISEGQGGISGGQKQRLMIARAVAPKPKILMFDEATSALDNLTQKKVSQAIDALKCTRIVIAHRLSTIRYADRIIYLDGGKIVEEGTYDELIAKNGRFADLVERQRLDVDVDQ